ncbi:MAG: pyridoxamine 5'-phosphate oxidase family protein [Phycisphaerae bacterium]|nr:pyridoxamine 5'-phosphate oxidase family protein [Phycisphaerae bacterium]
MKTTSAVTLVDDALAQAFHGEFVPKFLATRDAAGKPNVVPIVSLDAADERTLIFAELFTWKTRTNLATDPRVGVAVVTEDPRAWSLRGRFREYVESGPYVDRMNAKELFRYNAYVRVSRVGVIDVEAVTGAWRPSTLSVAASLVRTMLLGRLSFGKGAASLPARVADKFARTRSAKVVAWVDSQGHPCALPTFSLLPTRSDAMLFGAGGLPRDPRELGPGSPIAASVITTEPVAYQVKGTFSGIRRTVLGGIGAMHVTEVYSASPPLAGKQIEMPTTSPQGRTRDETVRVGR